MHVCSWMVSGSLHTPFGVLFSFPSRYYCAIGLGLVFSLGGCFPPYSLAIDKARYSALSTTSDWNSLREYHTLCSAFPGKLGRSIPGLHMLGRTPHLPALSGRDSVWALPFSLAAINGISIDFSSTWYSDVSFPRVCAPCGAPERLAAIPVDYTPFGHLRIEGCMHLPGAYRSLPRPSSPPKPKPFAIQRRCVG
jgi:hypothetical protein